MELSATDRGTALNRCRHKGPLYVQKPFYPEGRELAHIYLLHPPGGLVSGDDLTIDILAKPHSQSLITTPGAARAYRARDDSPVQRQTIQLSLEKGATMEWLPMETIIYDGAAAELTTHVELAEDSTFMGWEVTCLGLPASQQLMKKGYFTQRYQLSRQGIPIFIDHLHFTADNQALFKGTAGMQGKTASGFFIMGPFLCDHDEQQILLQQLRDIVARHSLDQHIAITMMNGFCIARYLGESANQARDGFSMIWQQLRPVLLERKACAPRIWLT